MPPEVQDEVHRLRKTMRDLVALSTLPAVWAGYAPQGIVGSLADVLLGTLSPDLVYVRAGDVEVVRGKGFTADHVQSVAEALSPWLTSGEQPTHLTHPLGGGELRVAISRFGHTASEGVVVVCSRRPDFPNESDRLLLGVGANQTATVLQRKRAELAVLEERERYRTTLSSIGDAVISTDALGRVTFMNPVAENLTGWPRDDAAGRPLPEVFRVVNEATRSEVENPALRALKEVVVVGLANHTVLIARDGTELPIDDSAAPIRAGGVVGGAVLVFRDITERHAAAKKLRVSEERYRSLVTASSDVVYVMSPDWSVMQPLDGRNLVATNVEPIRGWLEKNIPAHEHARIREAIRVAVEGRKPFELEHQVIRPDGTFGWTLSRAAPILDAAGNIVEWFGTARDVTDRKRAEAEAIGLAERLRLALDAGGLGTWEWDPVTDEMTVSARASEMYGSPVGVPHGREQGRQMIHPDDRERAREAAARAVAERTAYDIEYRLADRPVWVAAHGRGLYDAAGKLVRVYGVVQDVTDRKRTELELRDQDRKKDDFIALLAHELRNPLAPIRNGLQVLRLSDDRQVRTQAQAMMDRQLSHMVRLIDDLLDVSRINRNKMELRRERICLSDAVASAVEAAGPAIEAAGHELTVSLPASPIFLDADLTRLAQVFSNLLTNSAKYTERGGRVWLTARPVNGAVVVTVRDTGIGIPAASMPTLFDMFSQVDRPIERSTGGLGIGLALVKGLVEMHGGTVTAASEGLGRGSTFTVSLPSPSAVSPPQTVDAPDEAASASTIRRILVVDDNLDGADSLATMLKLLGNEVRTANDGIEAVEVAEAFQPDVVLMDVGMPRLNGLEATLRIRNQAWGRSMTIIALTGWGQDADRDRSREAGCDSHLVKPVNLSDLEKLLREFAGSGRG